MKSRFYSRKKTGGQHSVNQGQSVLRFGANGVAVAGGGPAGAFDASALLAQHESVAELGRLGLFKFSDDGTGVAEFVPASGKFVRLLALAHSLEADSTTADRVVEIDITLGSTLAENISHEAVVADASVAAVTLFGTNEHSVGSEAVAAEGILTVAVNPTVDDWFEVDGVRYTFITAANVGKVKNGIVRESTLGATKTNIAARLTKNLHPSVTFSAFSTNDVTITARQPGAAGNLIVLDSDFTSGSNGFDDGFLGDSVEGVDAADAHASIDYPAAGILLSDNDKIEVSVTDGEAGDAFEVTLFYLEMDNDPR